MATGAPVDRFSGGRPANSYLTRLGFTIVPVTHANSLAASPWVRFQRGNLYERRSQINAPFGGSRQSGISASSRTPAISIFTGDSGEQYGYANTYWYLSAVPELMGLAAERFESFTAQPEVSDA